VTLCTQNVDGFHQLAGSLDVIELHGNILRAKCSCENIVVDQWARTDDVPPCCPRCGAYLRPAVVWFGELLPPAALEAAVQAANTCDVFLSIGTSGFVEPAASLACVALQHSALVIEVNPTNTLLTARATFALRGTSGEILPALVKAVWAGA
jgi:NAD-dependent deacetylase